MLARQETEKDAGLQPAPRTAGSDSPPIAVSTAQRAASHRPRPSHHGGKDGTSSARRGPAPASSARGVRQQNGFAGGRSPDPPTAAPAPAAATAIVTASNADIEALRALSARPGSSRYHGRPVSAALHRGGESARDPTRGRMSRGSADGHARRNQSQVFGGTLPSRPVDRTAAPTADARYARAPSSWRAAPQGYGRTGPGDMSGDLFVASSRQAGARKPFVGAASVSPWVNGDTISAAQLKSLGRRL